MIGASLSHYRIDARLGAGGMGEVYRATDAKLDRDVAIKVLPAEVAGDAERLARFEREAKLLASLNHPNIAHVYGFESATLPDGSAMHFLAMELVAGEDLSERLKRGPISVAEAVAIAKQIAEALEEAHEKGIVHRDLKPANVKLTPDGKVKVLDFGLAKAYAGEAAGGSSSDLSQSPTLAHTGTQAGVILGTAAYMSPEQARGKRVDKRADIWAFGVLLYEMLTGRRLFFGESVADVLAAVVKQPIDWTALPAAAPPLLQTLIRRCLERDAITRLRDIGEARVALAAGANAAASPALPAPLARSHGWLVPAAFVAGIAVATLAAWLLSGRSAEQPPVRRFVVSGLDLTIDALQGLALSPDGSRLVFRGRGDDGVPRLYMRALDSLEVAPIEGTEEGWSPFFSPDGRWLGFFTRTSLKKVALSGGAPLPLSPVTSATGGAWLSDDTLVFASEVKGLERVPASGGEPETLLAPAAAGPFIATPWPLPGGKALLLVVRRGDVFDVATLTLADRKLRVIAEDGFAPAYATTGHVVYQQGQTTGTLLALPFDATRLVATGSAFAVLSDIGARVSFQARTFGIAGDGTLAYFPRSAFLERGALLWVDRGGGTTPIVEVERPLDTPRLSPDGRFVAFRATAPNCDVWVHELKRGVTTRVTLEGDNHGVVWSPDGDRLAVARGNDLDWLVLAGSIDGSGRTERLAPQPVPRAWASSWSPDGRALLVGSRRSQTGADVELLSIPDGRIAPLFQGPFEERGAVFSPDGRFVAYVSNESGRDEVYVNRLPALDARQQISTDGGTEPGWSRDGRELFFRRGRRLMVVAAAAGAAFSASRPRLLFEADFAEGASGERGYDADLDGQRFVVARARSRAGQGEVRLVLGWFDELRRRASGGRP